MKLERVKALFLLKNTIVGGLDKPDDDTLALLCDEATRYVATRCLPSVLLRNAPYASEEVLRGVGAGFVIVAPEYPDFTSSDTHLMIDESLNNAVINKMNALYARDANSIMKFEHEATQVINLHKANFSRIKDGIDERELDELCRCARVINDFDMFGFLEILQDKVNTWGEELI